MSNPKTHLRLYRKPGSSLREFSSQSKASVNSNIHLSSGHFDRSVLPAAHTSETPVNDLIHRKCSLCGEKENSLQKKESNSNSISTTPSIVSDVLSSGGRSLDTDTRSFMESRFNYDFSSVKIHDNDVAAKSADSINALAYTSGNSIVFNSGQYNTNSDQGKRLLAHELTHVVQQNDMISRQPAPPQQARRFSHQGVSVLIRTSCDSLVFGLDTVEEAFKEALDKIFDDDCIQITRRRAIQNNLKKHGYDVRCRNSAAIDGACAESTGFNIPANIMTLGDLAFTSADCGQLASTILHEIIHVTRGRFEEDVSTSCEASCFGEDGDPDLCRNIDVFGRRN